MHAHDHSRVRDRRLLGVALTLLLAFMAVEVAAGIFAGSLALLADAGHMLTDAAALNYSFVKFLMSKGPYRSLLTSLRNGMDFQNAFTNAYKGTPAQVARQPALDERPPPSREHRRARGVPALVSRRRGRLARSSNVLRHGEKLGPAAG